MGARTGVGARRPRDADVLPMDEFTTRLVTLERPPPPFQQVVGAVAGNQDAMSDFVGVTAGTVPPLEYLDPDDVERLMAAASAVA